MESKNALRESLQKLRGLQCKEVKYGAGSGSVVRISFEHASVNKNVLESSQQNSDTSLRIQVYCAWRIINHNKILASWRDIGSRDLILDGAFNSLFNQTVTDVFYDFKTNDVCLTFKNGITFNILCDISNDEEADENYIFYAEEIIRYVDFKGEIGTEEYSAVKKN